MALACLVCHSVESPRSFRSYSISSSENDGRCSAIANCLAKKVTLFSENTTTTSKVAPASFVADGQGTPRLIRSRAVTRDRVRDWNFDEVIVDN